MVSRKVQKTLQTLAVLAPGIAKAKGVLLQIEADWSVRPMAGDWTWKTCSVGVRKSAEKNAGRWFGFFFTDETGQSDERNGKQSGKDQYM